MASSTFGGISKPAFLTLARTEHVAAQQNSEMGQDAATYVCTQSLRLFARTTLSEGLQVVFQSTSQATAKQHWKDCT
eukprot:8075257-Lingulodinium_polyedra.AAC.1